ncbi:MAG: sulfatase-like hydrolase/transferase [Bryobacterales bacterium]
MRSLLPLVFCALLHADVSGSHGLPIVDVALERHRQTVVDREPGQYLGHPSTLLLPDARTMLVVYPKGHGKGGIVYKRSLDGGRSWSERLPTPANWETSRETPTLFRLIDRRGRARILLFSGAPGQIRIAYSEDDGASWGPLEPMRGPSRPFGGIVAMSSVVDLGDGSYMALFHDDGRWLREPAEAPEGKRFRVYKTVTHDGGLTWSDPEVVAQHALAHLCEPGALRSPDGRRIAVLLRENSRTLPSFLITSDDEGRTWSEPRPLPLALTGDRHVARYGPDGRLFVTFRDNGVANSPTRGDWVGWVGTFDDLIAGREGQYRVRLMDNTKGADTAYPGLELLPDGTFVTTTYGHWSEGEQPYIVSVRFRLQELDGRAAFAKPGELTSLVTGTDETFPVAGPQHPNVLFVAFDDLNDWALAEDSPLHMPNLEALAARATHFTRAYTASPACNPSRAALLLGKAAANTGIYGNRSDWKAAFPNVVTLPRYFLEQGYRVEGAGKIFHHHDNSAFHDDRSFHRFEKMQLDLMPVRKLNGVPEVASPNYDWGAWPEEESWTPDARAAEYAVRFLAEPRERPFFLALGLFRPHMPFHAPPRYFAQYPLDQLRMPVLFENDLDDIPPGGMKLWGLNRRFWDAMMAGESRRPGTWRESVQAYQASCSYADHQLGRVLTALAASPHAENTIIVVWSDHGYHLGEKQHWEKFALWERTTHVPLVVAAPGVTKPGTRVDRPVSLLDLYPTLVELAGLPARRDLDGRSLAPLLREPGARWDDPAVMTYLKGNHAVRTERWRYIRYADGSEELYDHERDPNEWNNVAESHPDVVEALRAWMPKRNADPAPDRKR